MNQYLAMGLAVLMLLSWGSFEHFRFISERSQYTEFKQQSEILRLEKEKEHASQITVALSMRDDAYRKLRASTERADSLTKSITAGASEKVCFRTAGLDAFLSGITQLLESGQGAIEDSRALLESWPR